MIVLSRRRDCRKRCLPHTNEAHGSLSLNGRNGVGNGDKVTRLRAEALCCKVSDVV